MIVKAYGTRGSVPVSGKNKSRYGGNTTCWRIKSQKVSADSEIVIDAGSGLIPFTDDINIGTLKQVTMLFTHYHQDHIIGLGLCPFIYMKGVQKKLFGPKDNNFGPMEAIKYCFSKPTFPVTDEQIKSSFINLMDNGVSSNHVLCFYEDLCASITLSEYENLISDCCKQVTFLRNNVGIGINIDKVLFVRNIEIAHPDKCVSYRFEEFSIKNEKPHLDSCFVLMTDCEAQASLPPIWKPHLNGANLIALDCQYGIDDYPKFAGFGHGNPAWVGMVAAGTDIPEIGIIHHDPHSTDEMVDKIVSECRSEADLLVNLKEKKIFGIKDYSEFTL